MASEDQEQRLPESAAAKQPSAENLPAADKQPGAEKLPVAEKQPAAKPAAKTSEKKAETSRTPITLHLSALGLLIAETLVPVLAAGLLVWWLFSNFHLWQQLNRTLGMVLFAAALVAVSLLLSNLIDAAFVPMRRRNRKKGAKLGSGPRVRFVKLILGGLVLPLVVFAALNFINIPTKGSVMNTVISTSTRPVVLTPPDQVGELAIKSQNPRLKLMSIQVLQGQQSPEALNQLLRVAKEDEHALIDPTVAEALAKAVGSYGTSAREPLLVLFKPTEPGSASAGVGLDGDLYTRYFATSFEALNAEITNNMPESTERAAQLAQLEAAQNRLKTSLGTIEDKGRALANANDLRLDFVLQSFLAMDLKQDGDLLTFARTTAADKHYNTSIRGDALLLVAKLGEKGDLDGLYAYLQDDDELLQAHALQAITVLQDKLSGAKTGE